MPTRSANLSRECNPCVLAPIEAGQLENPGKVMCFALRTLKRVERAYEQRVGNLHWKPDPLSHLRSLPTDRLSSSSPGPNAVLDHPIHQRA
jgi:hypothetical protein